jgi:peroxiredoxin family protein
MKKTLKMLSLALITCAVVIGLAACGSETNVFVDTQGMGYFTKLAGEVTEGTYAHHVAFENYTLKDGIYKVTLAKEPDADSGTMNPTEFVTLLKSGIMTNLVDITRVTKVGGVEKNTTTKAVGDVNSFIIQGLKPELYVHSDTFQALKDGDVMYTEFTFKYTDDSTKVFKLEITINVAA